MQTILIALIALTGLAECIQVRIHAKRDSGAGYLPPNGYTGNDLHTIAQDSADQAKSHVANQDAAGNQASYIANNVLAKTATRASEAAQAALTAKQFLLHSLEEQLEDARTLLHGEADQLQLAQLAAGEAASAAEKASVHVAVLTVALNSAHAAAAHADEAARESTNELASQTDMVTRAKNRLKAIEERLNTVRIEFAATQAATQKASESSEQAQKNADEARLNASEELRAVAAKQAGNEIDDRNFGNRTQGPY